MGGREGRKGSNEMGIGMGRVGRRFEWWLGEVEVRVEGEGVFGMGRERELE